MPRTSLDGKEVVAGGKLIWRPTGSSGGAAGSAQGNPLTSCEKGGAVAGQHWQAEQGRGPGGSLARPKPASKLKLRPRLTLSARPQAPPTQPMSSTQPTAVPNGQPRNIQAIVNSKPFDSITGKAQDRHTRYKVRWQGLGKVHDSFVDASDVTAELLNAYEVRMRPFVTPLL